ncbi:metallophosphoesterase [Longispora albida]|uniref:metallophosphoesterase n=1 Tax=Longispora albida TaxID=203523 RepID=UPI00035D99E1|nr:metallophosphoesterase [Longispora albida]
MRTRTVFRLAGAIGLAGAACVAYGTFVERVRYTLRRVDVPVLAADAEPLRVLQVTDLHMTPGQRGKQDWVASLAALDPDLVLLTGDNMAHPESLPGVLRAIEPLLDFPGAFVFGSNDYRGPVPKNPFMYFNPNRVYKQGADLPAEELRAALTSAGWADLNNAKATLKAGGKQIAFAGVDDPHIHLDDYDAVAGPADPEADVRIAVTHSPEPRVLDRMAADGYDLMMAGHTHGGQVCLPGVGALVTNCDLPRSMAKGLHWYAAGEHAAWLHVSAGLGTNPYTPFRFACPPEATILTLVPR